MKVGIVGLGTVGKAVYNGFSSVVDDMKTYDLDHGSIEDMYDRDFVFLCLPAPIIEHHQDISAIHETVDMITRDRKDVTFILKSTVLPGTTDMFQKTYGNNWCFNPEFLTDRTATLDFINSPRFILGGDDLSGVEALYLKRFPHTCILKMSSKSAEITKYMTNLYFMTKISFMNEMYNMVNDMGCDWDEVISGFSTDGRVESSHLQVPGFDGEFGFGGKCFPENIDSYLSWAERNKINHDMIKIVKDVNNKYRS